MKGSIFLTSFAGMYCAGSKSLTSPAIFVGKLLASKCVIGPMPLLPASTLPHALATSLPTGETMPRPVTTTRRFIDDSPAQDRTPRDMRRRIRTALQKRKLRLLGAASVATESGHPAAKGRVCVHQALTWALM